MVLSMNRVMSPFRASAVVRAAPKHASCSTRPRISRLVQAYQNGLTVYESATQSGIHRETVSGVLKRADGPRRRRPRSPHRGEMASIPYECGSSLAQVGAELDYGPSSLWPALAKVRSWAPR